MSLSDINCFEELPEPHDTLEANALEKAKYIREHYNYDCFADDSGLEVEALNGRPGVLSARYAGEEKSAEANMEKLLCEMEDVTNRRAKFRTVIALVIKGKEFLFEGSVNGRILTEKKGNGGFGYDPVFMPDGYALSFAEMSIIEKSLISHRAIAVAKLVEFLRDQKA